MKLAWLTDVHLDFIRRPEFWWTDTVNSTECDAFVITGDITTSSHVEWTVEMFADAKKPVYFVLGNHDYYGSSIEIVRKKLARLSTTEAGKYVKYLTHEDVIELSPKSSLVGDDGWYDGRNGKFFETGVRMNDFYKIKEFIGLKKPDLLVAIQKYADASARRLKDLCSQAVQRSGLERLYIATHIPPFSGAAWHMGQPSDDFWQPFFSNQCVGEAVKEATADFRKAGGSVVVLCGHSHGEGQIYPGSGMTVRTGKAIYNHPDVVDVLDVI